MQPEFAEIFFKLHHLNGLIKYALFLFGTVRKTMIGCNTEMVELRRDSRLLPGQVRGHRKIPFRGGCAGIQVHEQDVRPDRLEGDPPYVTLKCDPERAIEPRELIEAIQPGWHMNKVIVAWFYSVE
jgi:hypothetical protein